MSIAAGLFFLCTPIAVWDGDGPIWCAEGPRVRVAGIAAREVDGSCRRHHPCPPAAAEDAKGALANLVGTITGRRSTGHLLVSGEPMRCLSDGSARGNRTAAWCELPDGRDLSCAMLASGTVARWDRFWGDRRCEPQRGNDIAP